MLQKYKEVSLCISTPHRRGSEKSHPCCTKNLLAEVLLLSRGGSGGGGGGGGRWEVPMHFRRSQVLPAHRRHIRFGSNKLIYVKQNHPDMKPLFKLIINSEIYLSTLSQCSINRKK